MNQQKRVAFLLPSLAGGGIERVVINLIKEMAKRGVLLDLVLASAEGPYLKDVPSGVRVINLQTPVDFRLKSASQVIRPLVRYLRKEKPDFIVSHLYVYNAAALIALTLARIPAFLVLVEHLSLYKTKNSSQGIQRWMLPLSMRLLYPYAGAIVAVSKGLAREFEADLNLKLGSIKTIYNPVLDKSVLLKSQTSVEHSWFADGELPVILGVGRLVKQKDFPTLIRAFAQVRKVHPARLVILGEGPEKPKLMELVRDLEIEDDVALLGFTDNPYAYMTRAAVFVLSSAWEGLPTVLIEAMAVGTPVVSTNCENGPSEILDNGKYGSLVPVGDAKAMAEAISSVLSGNSKKVDPSWLNQFTIEASSQRYLNLMGICV